MKTFDLPTEIVKTREQLVKDKNEVDKNISKNQLDIEKMKQELQIEMM